MVRRQENIEAYISIFWNPFLQWSEFFLEHQEILLDAKFFISVYLPINSTFYRFIWRKYFSLDLFLQFLRSCFDRFGSKWSKKSSFTFTNFYFRWIAAQYILWKRSVYFVYTQCILRVYSADDLYTRRALFLRSMYNTYIKIRVGNWLRMSQGWIFLFLIFVFFEQKYSFGLFLCKNISFFSVIYDSNSFTPTRQGNM